MYVPYTALCARQDILDRQFDRSTCNTQKKNSSFFLFKLNIFFALTAAAVAQREKARTPFFAAAQCTQRKSWSVCHATHETDLSHVAQAKSRG